MLRTNPRGISELARGRILFHLTLKAHGHQNHKKNKNKVHLKTTLTTLERIKEVR